MAFTRNSYIGHTGSLWERVTLVFEGLGYQPPRPDTPDGGAYLTNIADQYRADLSEEEVIQIVEYASANVYEYLYSTKEQGWIDRAAVFGERSL